MACSSHGVHFVMVVAPHRSTLFPYTTLFRSALGARSPARALGGRGAHGVGILPGRSGGEARGTDGCRFPSPERSEEHTSELQSRFDLVCRLLLEKKKNSPLPGDVLTC